MTEYDPIFIQKWLDAPRQELRAYFLSLPEPERKELRIALFRANSDLVAQELVGNLDRTVNADDEKRREQAAKTKA